jgi:hypothetical protein
MPMSIVNVAANIYIYLQYEVFHGDLYVRINSAAHIRTNWCVRLTTAIYEPIVWTMWDP